VSENMRFADSCVVKVMPCVWVTCITDDGDKDREVRQLIESYVQQTEQLRFDADA